MGIIKTAVALKCARCGEGRLFEHKNPYKLGHFFSMKSHCSHCGLKYEKEAGFFYGAMYVSYMINIALFVTATVAYYLVFEDKVSFTWYNVTCILIILLLAPVIFRFSRATWLMFMTSYEPEKRGER